MKFILIWTGTYKPPSLCPATTLCSISRMFCRYVTSCVEARHNHDRSNFGANVGQIKQSLSTCGDNYTYRAEVVLGRNPWFWRKWSTFERSSCIRELPIFLHFYTTTTISSVSWARGTVCQYILQFWDIFWYRSDVEEFLSWKWWLWWVLDQTLQSGLHLLIWGFLPSHTFNWKVLVETQNETCCRI